MTERQPKSALAGTTDESSPQHFWLKWWGCILLVATEAFIITLLCYRFIGPRPLWAVFLCSFAVAFAIDLTILKIYLTFKKRKKSC